MLSLFLSVAVAEHVRLSPMVILLLGVTEMLSNSGAELIITMEAVSEVDAPFESNAVATQVMVSSRDTETVDKSNRPPVAKTAPSGLSHS